MNIIQGKDGWDAFGFKTQAAMRSDSDVITPRLSRV